jgi:hypothetical protein
MSLAGYPSITSRIIAAPTLRRLQLVQKQHLTFALAASPTFLQRQVRKQSNMSFQAPHPTLLIPGPIEFDDEVLRSMSHYRYVIDGVTLVFCCCCATCPIASGRKREKEILIMS